MKVCKVEAKLHDSTAKNMLLWERVLPYQYQLLEVCYVIIILISGASSRQRCVAFFFRGVIETCPLFSAAYPALIAKKKGWGGNVLLLYAVYKMFNNTTIDDTLRRAVY